MYRSVVNNFLLLAVSLKQYKKVYEDIREMEKKLDSARKQLVGVASGLYHECG